MSVPVLVFSDAPLSVAMQQSKLYTYHAISSEEWKQLVDNVSSSPDTRFILSCGAEPRFVALSQLWKRHGARAILTISEDESFWPPKITPMPSQILRRWIHRTNPNVLKDEDIYKCLLLCNDSNAKVVGILTGNQKGEAHGAWGSSQPLISVFTSTFHSGETKLGRALQSMLTQTYNNWEWVIVDDSKNDADTSSMLRRLAEQDLRIRHYDLGHSGFIGEAKWRAANLCRGDWLVELDHDDRLVPALLDTIVKIGERCPDIGVIYSDFCTIGVNEKETEYCLYFKTTTAYGAAGYMGKFWRGQWHPWYIASPLNNLTLCDIVGVPNHVRSFKRELYHAVGGYNFDLPIADDYDIMLRLFMSGARWARIAEPMYLQYENVGGDNFTNHRRTQIRGLQTVMSQVYYAAYQHKYAQLSGPDHCHPTLLEYPTKTQNDTGCYDLPHESRLKLEYTWQNGKLYYPVRERQCADVIHKKVLARSRNKTISVPNISPNIVSHLLKITEATIILVVNNDTNLKSLMRWMDLLKPLASQVYIIGHPDSILRALQRQDVYDPNPDMATATLTLRQFHVWCFGMGDDGYYKNGYESWQQESKAVVQHHLANYGLKIVTCTGYVMYLDASEPITDETRAMMACTSDDELPSKLLPLYGNVLSQDDASSVLHGFLHHTAIPELYGYWQLDGRDQIQMIRLWEQGAAKLEAEMQKKVVQ